MSYPEPCDFSFLDSILACPYCRAKLHRCSGTLCCTECSAEFAQSSQAWVNLYPEKDVRLHDPNWTRRQEEMEDWYRILIVNRRAAADCFRVDYTPYASLIETLTGRVLDIGGGIGLTRHFLPADTRYVVVDPSLDWLSVDWTALSDQFPCLSTPPCFVHGIGERLPFRDASFDSAVALWSLNHATDPATVFSEVARVLVPGGRFLAVLEDMIPRWRDAFVPTGSATGEFRWPRILARKTRLALLRQPWPLQSDHIRIDEGDVEKWTADRFDLERRAWIGRYLTFEFIRTNARNGSRAFRTATPPNSPPG
jgi:SAM-dependent methyltransferase